MSSSRCILYCYVFATHFISVKKKKEKVNKGGPRDNLRYPLSPVPITDYKERKKERKKAKNNKDGYYLPTPPLGQDMTQGQFLSGV